MATRFKYDAYSNLSKYQKTIAKAIWLSHLAVPNGQERYKVPKEIEDEIGKICFWPHEADKIISTNPSEYGKLITLGEPYIFVYLER